MLVECGFVRAVTDDGDEFTFLPSFGKIAGLGSPQEVVKLYAGLHGQRAESDASYVLACLCEQDDPTALTGWLDDDGFHDGLMSPDEKIIIARHLMQHGIIGKAQPAKGDGKFSDAFNAHEYISAACVHLGLSRTDASDLSMTEFQTMFEMKFPDKNKRDVPSREEYEAGMQKLKKK